MSGAGLLCCGVRRGGDRVDHVVGAQRPAQRATSGSRGGGGEHHPQPPLGAGAQQVRAPGQRREPFPVLGRRGSSCASRSVVVGVAVPLRAEQMVEQLVRPHPDRRGGSSPSAPAGRSAAAPPTSSPCADRWCRPGCRRRRRGLRRAGRYAMGVLLPSGVSGVVAAGGMRISNQTVEPRTVGSVPQASLSSSIRPRPRPRLLNVSVRARVTVPRVPESATETSSRSALRSISTRAAVPACSSALVVSSLVHSTAAPITDSGTCHSVSWPVIQCRTRLGAVGSAGTSMLAERLGLSACSTASTATSSSVPPGDRGGGHRAERAGVAAAGLGDGVAQGGQPGGQALPATLHHPVAEQQQGVAGAERHGGGAPAGRPGPAGRRPGRRRYSASARRPGRPGGSAARGDRRWPGSAAAGPRRSRRRRR